MYAIHFRRSFSSRRDYVETARDLPTLEAARDARIVCGDLVVDQATGEVVRSRAWLWDWEKASSGCYAQKAIADSKPEFEHVFDQWGYPVAVVEIEVRV